ncbi:MAG: hypothetical protein ACTHN7_08670 [Solirubrobacterales bacterium]
MSVHSEPPDKAAEAPTTTLPTEEKPEKQEEETASFFDEVKMIGGLVAVAIGVLAVGIIAVVAILKDKHHAGTISSAAGGVIATMVGAYFGVKVGTDQSKTAADNQKAEAAKAQVYALHLDPHKAKADEVLKEADKAAERALKRRRG